MNWYLLLSGWTTGVYTMLLIAVLFGEVTLNGVVVSQGVWKWVAIAICVVAIASNVWAFRK